MRFFVDANVLIYMRDFRDRTKQQAATRWMLHLVDSEAALVNLQVLNEVCNAGLRKLGHLTATEMRRWIDDLAVFGSAPIDLDTVKAAWPIHTRYRLNWFDCLIVSAADRLGCTHLLTEDMGSPRRIGSIYLVNPFAAEPAEFIART